MPFNVSDPVLFYNKKIFAGGRPRSRTSRRRRSTTSAPTARRSSTPARRSTASPLDSGFDSGGGWYLEQWFAKLGEFYADNENGRAAPATQVLYDNDTGVDLLTQVQSLIKDGLAVYVGDNASGQDNLLKLADDDRSRRR